MQKRMTVQQLAEETNMETGFLLKKIKLAGLPQTGPDDSIDQQDRQKIKDILRKPKKTLSRRKEGHQGFMKAKGDGFQKYKKKDNSQRSPSKERMQRRTRPADTGAKRKPPFKQGAQKENYKERKQTSLSAGRARTSAINQRSGLKVAFPKPKPDTKSLLKDKKSKQKTKPTKELLDKEEKTRKRFGVLISAEDALEMEEIKKKQKIQDAYSVSHQTVARGQIKIKNVHKFVKPTQNLVKQIEIDGNMEISRLAHQLGMKSGRLLQKIHQMGFQATETDLLEKETSLLVIEELGHKAILPTAEESSLLLFQSLPVGAIYQPRPPLITVMGHVDHGKTTLLDFIRKTKQVDKEAGQITQHLGAYRVSVKDRNITFFDTPGHAAFSEMRLKGARLTDIVVLVVAADDGVMPQTREAVTHIQSSKTAVVVAINKIDKEGTDAEKVRKELSSLGLVAEEWGGDVPFVEISATTGKGIDALLETLLVLADVLELKAATEVPARGRVIESRLDGKMGPIAVFLVQHGILKKGDMVCMENYYGRIKMMFDDLGQLKQQAQPSDPIEVLGLNGVPPTGDEFMVVPSEKEAKRVVEQNAAKVNNQSQGEKEKVDFAALMAETQQQRGVINLIIKTDVSGSLAAINQLIEEIESEEMDIKMVSQGVGAINVTDVHMAKATEALVIGFNVRPDSAAKKEIKQQPSVAIHYFSVIYELGEELKRVVKERSEFYGTEKIIGVAQVKEVFSARKFGQIAGCEVTEGTIFKDKPIRVLRDDTVIYEGTLESLRRFKDDVEEVQQGVECGIGVKGYRNVKVGDQIEVYDKRAVK